MRKWESEKHKSWGMPAEGFKGHVATDGSLLGNAGKWRACGWAVVQLDYDEEMGPLYEMYGSVEAEYEVQRTIKRPEMTAFLCFLKKVIGPTKVHVDNKGIIMDYEKEKKCIMPRAGDADLWIKIRVELHGLVERGILLEVEHVNAHRTKKEKEKMSQFERSSSPNAMRRPMSWQNEHCWTKGLWLNQERKLCSRNERRCTQPCSMRPASSAW